MKCKYCGADVRLDDHFCPNCGRPVEQAIRHQKEMEQYEKEFEKTRRQAMDRISVSGGFGTAVGIRLAVVVALIVALVAMAVNLNSYSLNERREKRAAARNHDAYVEQIEKFIEDRDYAELAAFCDKHQLDYNKDFEEYRRIIYGAESFRSVYRGLWDVAFCTQDTRYMYNAENLSKNVNNFYEQLQQDYSYSKNPERTKEVYGEMEEEMLLLLRRYLGLSKEDTDSMKELSKSKRTVMIEEALDARLVEITGKGLNEMKTTELPTLEDPQENAPEESRDEAQEEAK